MDIYSDVVALAGEINAGKVHLHSGGALTVAGQLTCAAWKVGGDTKFITWEEDSVVTVAGSITLVATDAITGRGVLRCRGDAALLAPYNLHGTSMVSTAS